MLNTVSQRSKGVSIELKLLPNERDPATMMTTNSKRLFSHIKSDHNEVDTDIKGNLDMALKLNYYRPY